jgi:DNA (cytosine-5)-methyltransferase 1
VTIGSLFSGIGGLELGLEALGLGPVRWQCEIDPFARAVLAKHWPEVKRYEDVRGIDETIERVDIIAGGFPCQDISDAGKRAGIDGERSGLWAEYARIVRLLRPRFVFVENVAALTIRGLDRVLGDLASSGYSAEWDCFRASDAGAPHKRSRIFVLAYADGTRGNEPDADGARLEEREEQPSRDERAASKRGSREALADADGGRREELRRAEPDRLEGSRGSELDGRRDHRRVHRFPPGPEKIGDWNGAEPAVCRGPHGIPGRVDRLKCLGNAVVPQQAAYAWQTLIERVKKNGGTRTWE